ncbi:histidine kinase N-terminal 7TM domain-containing protein [Haloarchaeobius sp. TZWWS8]|uniref:histidine kinase N-terminal 7TM domain-containing protein n=1 Tax=Haloarchaeobius sp. TZWWS8 TaxID=3446121 RepID=UPI003EBD9CC6
MAGVPWPAVGALVAGVANLFFLRKLQDFRGQPGVRWFQVVIAAQFALCLSQGLALLVFDPTLRLVLEIPFYVTGSVVLVSYLGFAATYTGRGHLVHTVWFRSLVVAGAAVSVLAVSNPLHQLVWSDFRLDPVLGAATVSYTHQPLVRLQFVGVVLVSLVGMFILFDTVASYGPLYRKQAIAVALTPVPPTLAFAVWTFHLGPVPQWNLVPIMFIPHIALDMYALFHSDMFEFNPTTRRTGERAAVDDLGSPVVVVDQKGRIVTLNEGAQTLFGVDKETALTRSLDEYVPVGPLDPAGFERTIGVDRGGHRSTVKLTAKPLRDAADTHVGYTVVLQDVTEEIRRKQRLTVLNRVLRHNLRNDLTVVRGYLEAASDQVHDETVSGYLETALDETSGLVELGEKARQVERTMDAGAATREQVAVDELLTEVVADLDAPDAGAVDLAIPDGYRIESNGALLELAFSNLVENALVHHDGPAPDVTVTLVESDGTSRSATFEVSDDGPGIPEHELAVLTADEETPLEHGSGLGLWVATWAVGSLGGDLSFETGPSDGTTVTLRVPDEPVSGPDERTQASP